MYVRITKKKWNKSKEKSRYIYKNVVNRRKIKEQPKATL